MEEIYNKQKELIDCLYDKSNEVLPRKNLFSLNLKNIYNTDDETYKLFQGILPHKDCINLDIKPITSYVYFDDDKKIKYEDLTSEFLNDFKKQYEILINIYYDTAIKNDRSKIETRLNNESHDGSKNTVMSSKHGDIDIYLFECFNYNELNDSEKDDFCELMSFYDSLWEKRENIFKNIEIECNNFAQEIKPGRFQDIGKKEQLDMYERILKIKELEETEHIWIKDSSLKLKQKIWDTLYKLDNELRHGVEDQLGYLTENNAYNNVNKIFKLRKEQLQKLQHNTSKCPEPEKMSEFIESELAKLNIPEPNKIQLPIYPRSYYPPQKRYEHLIEDPIKKHAIDLCNNSQWSYLEEDKDYEINIEEVKNDILYRYIDYDNHNDPCNFLPLYKRQYIYGFSKDIERFVKYNQYFRVLNPPPDSLDCNENLVHYSQFLNKLVTFCASNADLIFPVRFVLKNPFKPNLRSLNKITRQIIPTSLLKYKFIGMFVIKRKELKTNTDISYRVFILKNIDKQKIDIHYIKGKYSHFVLIDERLQIIDISTIFPIKNIAWDEFNTIYKWLNKPIYYYCKDKDNNNDLINLFVHNIKYKIPIELNNEINKVDKDIYDQFNISYKDLYSKIDPNFLLNKENINDLFFENTFSKLSSIPISNESTRLSSRNISLGQPRSTSWGQSSNPFSTIQSRSTSLGQSSNPFSSIQSRNTRRNIQFGGKKIYYPEYISEYKNKLIDLRIRFEDALLKNEKKIFYNIDIEEELFNIFNPYLLLDDRRNDLYIKNKKLNSILNMDYKVNKRYYESLYIYNLVNKNNMDILEINNYMNFSIYNLNYIANNKKISINCYTHLFTAYKHESFEPVYNSENVYTNDIKNISKSNKVDIYNKYIDKEILMDVIKKYDLICCNISVYFLFKFRLFLEEQSLNLKFIFIIYSLLRLNKNGHLYIGYGDISTIQSYQIINNLIPYFDEIIVHNQDTKVAYKQTGTDIICKKFKNNFNIKKFDKLINEIFILDKTLGNEFDKINNNENNKIINIYKDNYSINTIYDKKLLNDIKIINNKKHFFIIKTFYDAIYMIKTLTNYDIIRKDITKYYNYLTIVCSYKKGIELNLIKKTDITNELKIYIKEIIKNLKKNIIITENIGIYKKINKTDNNPKLNIEKLQVIQDFYYFINGKTIKNNNIFNILNFSKYKQSVYELLQQYKNVYLSYNSDDLYNIEIIYKKDDNYLLTIENKNTIDDIMITFFNKIIDITYERQYLNYYLDMYHL